MVFFKKLFFLLWCAIDFCVMKKFFINSIYCATEGEGIFVGTPQVFVRFFGCDIHCHNCDSKDTWEFKDKKPWTLNEVLSEIELQRKGKIKRISMTGGDPLHINNHEQVKILIQELKSKKFIINIETSGFFISHQLFDLVDFISFDFKTPSSGKFGDINKVLEMQRQYIGRFQVKSVIQTKEDFDFVEQTYYEILKKAEMINFPWCLTPAYNLKEEFPQGRFINITSWNENTGGLFRVIGQQHKWIYGPDKKRI